MKTLAALAAAAALAATVAAPTAAFAHSGHHHGDAVAAGVLGFLGGAIVGGALAQPAPQPVYVQPAPVYVDPGRAHVAWCAGHYRSYSAYDNTFIDRHGRVRLCVSPYLR